VFAILLRVEAKPGKELELRLDCETSSRLEPRTLRFDVLRDRTKDRSFYVYEAYEDAEFRRGRVRARKPCSSPRQSGEVSCPESFRTISGLPR
jgi:hypothetical protein